MRNEESAICCQNGAFTSPEIKTAADMQRFCIGNLDAPAAFAAKNLTPGLQTDR